MRSPIWGLALGVACTAIVACAASHKSASVAAPAATDGGMPMGRGDHDEIQRLSDEIAKQRDADHLIAPATPCNGCVPMTTPMPKSTDPSCQHGTGDTCASACTIADSICDNATKICKLADTMPSDRWASDKCGDAQTSCTEANTKCCGCH